MAGRASADPTFSSPVACDVGRDCFVQNYVDVDASAGAADFTCGNLTYDGHKGTDVRLRNYVEMEKGVDVVAAAPGTVLRLRDGMDDIRVNEIGVAAIKDRMAGNSVIVDHGNGWVTQYGHMKKGSIAVKPGQHVDVGDKLGQIGLSGNTEFPHLHFEVRHDDKPVDPYTGEAMGAGCDVSEHMLWRPEVARIFAYRPTGLLGAGFAIGKPEAEAARHGAYSDVAPGRDSAALVFWVDLFGLQAGDKLLQTLTGPDGRVLAQSDKSAPKPKAQFFAFIGKKKPPEGWPSGLYQAAVSVSRGGKAVIETKAEIRIP